MKTVVDNVALVAITIIAILSMWFSGCRTVGPAPAAAQDELVGEVMVTAPAPIAWDDETRLASAQCLVAEARWRNRTEHSAILHVLERRWRAYNAAHPDARITFVAEVRQFCHLHRAGADRSSNGWALRLPWGPMTEDPGMGPTVNWRQWRDDWDYARETLTMFEHDELADPMPMAVTFGGAMDSAAPSLVWLGPTTHSVANGQRILLHNRFYATRGAVERAARRAAQ